MGPPQEVRKSEHEAATHPSPGKLSIRPCQAPKGPDKGHRTWQHSGDIDFVSGGFGALVVLCDLAGWLTFLGLNKRWVGRVAVVRGMARIQRESKNALGAGPGQVAELVHLGMSTLLNGVPQSLQV